MRDFRNFDRFLSSLTHQVYPEIPSDMARNFTRSGIEWLRRDGHLTDAMRVLDVGCGQGVALEIFRDLGISAVGITLVIGTAATAGFGCSFWG